MPNQYRSIQLKRIENGNNVITETICGIRGFGRLGSTGFPKPSPRYAVHVVRRGELNRKFIEIMRCYSKTGYEDKRSARATPVQHLKPDVRVNGDELNFVRRCITILPPCAPQKQRCQYADGERFRTHTQQVYRLGRVNVREQAVP